MRGDMNQSKQVIVINEVDVVDVASNLQENESPSQVHFPFTPTIETRYSWEESVNFMV